LRWDFVINFSFPSMNSDAEICSPQLTLLDRKQELAVIREERST
jgi:hypothetical protein